MTAPFQARPRGRRLRRTLRPVVAALLALGPLVVSHASSASVATPAVLALVQLGSDYSEALAVDGHTVVGYETSLATGNRHGVAWDLTTNPVGRGDLPPPAGYVTAVASAVDGSIVVGTAATAGNQQHAVAWNLGATPVTVTDLGSLAGDPTACWNLLNSSAVAVEGNIVVGYSRNSFGCSERRHAFTYDLSTNGPMSDLGTFGTPHGQAEWSTASAVRGGAVVGTATTNYPIAF